MSNPSESLQEIDRRLSIARLYQKLLRKESFFSSNQSDLPETKEVDARLRTFIESELETLLGLKQLKNEELSESETVALKLLASKVIQKSQILEKEPLSQSNQKTTKETIQKTIAKKTRKKIPKKQTQGVMERKYKEVKTPGGKTVKMDVTGQVQNPDALPLPSPGQMAAMANLPDIGSGSVGGGLGGQDLAAAIQIALSRP